MGRVMVIQRVPAQPVARRSQMFGPPALEGMPVARNQRRLLIACNTRHRGEIKQYRGRAGD
jgi:hypothetical protein